MDAAAAPEHRGSQQPGHHRADQDGRLRGLGLGRPVRQLADQECDGEPDAGQHGHAGNVAPAQVGVELRAGEPGDHPRAAEHADRLADHQPQQHPEDHRVGDERPVEVQHDAGRQQREERHRHARGHRGQPVLEPLGGGARLVLVGQHPGQQPQGDAGDGGVHAALVHAPPGRGRERQVHQGRRDPTLLEQGVDREQHHRQQERHEVQGRGVEHRDHHDHDQVVDDGQREQEGPKRRRQRGPGDGQHREREGDVGGRRDRPAPRVPVAEDVDRREHQRRRRHPGHGGHDGHRRVRGAP
jgi:hypothetical protein